MSDLRVNTAGGWSYTPARAWDGTNWKQGPNRAWDGVAWRRLDPLLIEQWSGNDGDPWAAEWILRNGTASLQGGYGVLHAAGYYGYAACWTEAPGTDLRDIDLSLSFVVPSITEWYLGLSIDITSDTDTSQFYPSDAYCLEFGMAPNPGYQNYYWIHKRVGGTDATFGAVVNSAGLVRGSTYRVRFQRIGKTVRFRYWLEGSSEPATWTDSYVDSDTQPASGSMMVAASSGNSAELLDLTVADLQLTIAKNEENWIGTDGSPWPASWTTRYTSDSTSYVAPTIQSGGGLQISPTGIGWGYDAQLSAMYLPGIGDHWDFFVDFSTQGTATDDDWFLTLALNSDATSVQPTYDLSPQNGTMAWIGWDPSTQTLYSQWGYDTGGSESYAPPAPKPTSDWYVPGSTYSLHVRREADLWSMWVWPQGEPQPSVPDTTVTQTASGDYFELGLTNGAKGYSYGVNWSNLRIQELR